MLDFAWLPQPVADALQKLFRKVKAKFEVGLVPIGLAVLTIVLGIVGWSRISFDGHLHSIVLIAIRSLADFTPSVKNLDEGNDFTDAAALCGLLTIYSSAAVITANVLRESYRKLLARLWSHEHVLIIGDTKLAQHAAKVWLRRDKHPLRIVAPALDRPTWKSRCVRHALDETLVNAVSLPKARAVFLDLGEDGTTLALAFRLLKTMMSDTSTDEPATGDREWVVIGRDIDMADHFIAKVRELQAGNAATVPLPRIHFLDPERLEARRLVANKALFLEAEERGARCIHILIIGFEPIAWHLIEMTYLSGLTAQLDPPRVTVLTPQADMQRRRFLSGRAALAEAIDVAFLEFDALDDFQTGETGAGRLLRDRDATAPVTTIFSVLDSGDLNIRTAMRIDAIHRKTDRLGCSILMRAEDAGDEDALSSGGRFGRIIGGFSDFGLTDDMLERELCDAMRRDSLARALHARYVATLPAASRAVPAWDDLSETLRRANRNAAAHCLAKLHIFGFDVRDLPPGVLPRLSDADAAALGRDRETFRQVARCEHERWMIERRLDGWTLGETWDDRRRMHPLLVPWDVLVERYPDQVDKNNEQVQALILCLQDIGDPGTILKRKAAANAMSPG